jgi:hypothetical protein
MRFTAAKDIAQTLLEQAIAPTALRPGADKAPPSGSEVDESFA